MDIEVIENDNQELDQSIRLLLDMINWGKASDKVLTNKIRNIFYLGEKSGRAISERKFKHVINDYKTTIKDLKENVKNEQWDREKVYPKHGERAYQGD